MLHLQRREVRGTPGRPTEHQAGREWTQLLQRAGGRQASVTEKLRADPSVANSRVVRPRGQRCRGRCQRATGQFRDGAEGGLPASADFFDP